MRWAARQSLEMDAHTLRDCLSVTGVDSPGKSIAARSNGQLIFKKSANQLYYFDVHEMSSHTLRLSRMDPLYDDCQIYDLAFCERGTLLICLQRFATGEFFICEGLIDCTTLVVDITGSVHKTNIVATKGRNVVLICDEVGVVLLSYPIRWQSADNTIELFHATNYLISTIGDKYTISLHSREMFDAVFSSPFISRNHLYLFYGHDYSKFLLIPLTGTSCGKCEVRRTQGSPPPDSYMSKTVQCFEDFALIYANQSVRNTRPNFYLLNLTNLSWYPLNLVLSHHFPNGNISLQKCGEEMVYLHGDCNMSNCIERTHLYQISVEPLSALVRQKRRRKSLNNFNFMNFSTAEQTNNNSSKQSVATNPISRLSIRYLSRFQKKANAKRRLSNKTAISPMNSHEGLVEPQPLRRSHSSSSLHWSADMVELAPQSLHSQLKLAKDMGYSEEVVLAALESQAKNKDGMYVPFESTNAMLDILNQAALRKSASPLPVNTPGSSINDRKASRSSSRNVPRSLSFHGGSPSLSCPRSDELSRLLRTFEAEKARDLEAAESDMALLKARIHDVERINEQYQRNENELRDCIHELQQRNESLISDLEKCENEKIQLSQTIVELQAVTDRLTLENLRNEHQAKDQKELAEHRKKQYDQQISAMEESIRSLTEKCNSLSVDLKDKEKQLLEKSRRIQEMEDRRIAAATGNIAGKDHERIPTKAG
ncbi:hypothetical protein KIN20_019904 [Parelaphostrongylus tenuis]|uniref:Uncharacterized protein n=1 Tax=Parelaphostrongylus tenuis TaxID=148309 RepID=A0AAD5QT96_PARTN|nr:hypothetical protein KIN20_019904 [Parelaphostrongylus tenuis]